MRSCAAFGGQRVASLVSADSSWQDDTLASASWESPVQFASLWGDRPVLQVTLSATAQTAATTTLALLFVTLFLLPPGRRRRAVLGMRLGRGPALSLALLVATGTMPWPLLIQPAEASCTGCNCPTPIPPSASDISYFHYDHLGSPLLITDGNGAVAEQIRYHPYGAVRGRFNSAGNLIGEPGADEVRYEFTGYEAERNTGLLYANARFYDPELGSFMSHDPAAQFWSPYTYVGWDPMNRTDPSGAFDPTGLLYLVAFSFAVGFTASTFNALANGASFGESLKAGLIGGALGAVTAPIGAYVLQPALAGLVGVVFAAGEATAASVASSILFVSGLGQAFYSGTQGDSSAAFGLAIGLTVGAILAKGAQPSVSRGGNGAGGFDNNTALAVAEGRLYDVGFSRGGLPLYGPSDLGPGDVLLTGEGGLAQYLKTTGDYGHGGVVADADGFMSVSVGSSDNRGIYVAPNSDPAVGGRAWDVFHVPGVDPGGVRAFFSTNAGAGYLSGAGGNVCSSCVARSIELGGGPFAPRAVGNLVTPNVLGRFYGPPVGRIMMPRY